MTRNAARVLRVLRETGPRPMTVITGLVGKKSEVERVVGELFIAGVVRWVSAKRWRQLGATKARASFAFRRIPSTRSNPCSGRCS